MFKGQGQTTLEPSVLSALYILIPCLLAVDRFCFYRKDEPEFCTMGAYMFLKHFLLLVDLTTPRLEALESEVQNHAFH